jgi:hypothetical protein
MQGASETTPTKVKILRIGINHDGADDTRSQWLRANPYNHKGTSNQPDGDDHHSDIPTRRRRTMEHYDQNLRSSRSRTRELSRTHRQRW